MRRRTNQPNAEQGQRLVTTITKEVTSITTILYLPIRISIYPPSIYPFRPPTIHQYSSEYNVSTIVPIESSHPTLTTALFFRIVQFILGGETTQGIYYSLPTLSNFTTTMISWLV